MSKCEVIVGNVGTVHSGNNYVNACKVYGEYKRLSKGTQGQVSGEDVCLMVDGEIKLEYVGKIRKEEENKW